MKTVKEWVPNSQSIAIHELDVAMLRKEMLATAQPHGTTAIPAGP